MTTLLSIIILIILVFAILFLFTVFINRKNQLIEEQERIKKEFQNELVKSQIEIREETLRNISWELHDNIGQLLSLAKINAQLAKDNPHKLEEAIDILGSGMKELRALSKSINPESINKLNLISAIRLEIGRYNRLGYIESNLSISGTPFSITTTKEIILFRILQEFFGNTIKHAKSSTLNINLNFNNEELHIQVSDNGVGFDQSKNYEGMGLLNMQTRAKVIDAQLEITSTLKQGTSLNLYYRNNPKQTI